ncbi:response regulator [Paenibacillus albiflavus]|uniref:Response regulator n=1 Tax=Paenibacillus albiflavus TaxID=2545760 RepID=A0A4R4EDL5_9BACL|nr:response regulator [Paenibacillus albiflavus]TCZ77120.1 response regulator [Paenibacillus albiflavus]
MRIMIVDDEVIIRTGLCTVIDWKELGLDLLPAAASAEEVLERIPSEKPHIVLTDIRMPGMDGIALAQEIKKLLPDTEIVILTGYDDFAYAQQALRGGVTDYLLKTSGPEEIIKAAMKAKHNIMSKWEMMKRETEQSAALRSRLLEQLLTGQLDQKTSIDPLLDWLAKRNVFHYETSKIQNMQSVLLSATGWGSGSPATLLLGATENMLIELLPCVTLMKKDRIMLVTRVPDSLYTFDELLCAVRRVEDTLKCHIFATRGCIVQLCDELARSYQEAEEVFAYRGLLGGVGVHEYSMIKNRSGGRTVCSEKEENELAAILMGNNATRLRLWVNGLVNDMLLDQNVTLTTLQAFMQSLVIAGHRWLERAKGGHSMEITLAPTYVYDANDQLEEEVFKLLASIMSAFHESIADHRYSYIHLATAYIRNNLDQNVTLQQVARHVHINPNHLSEVFKKETGQSYIEFVTQERMKLAAEILRTSQVKISEVAGKVGYEDIKYFGQQFKKYMGQTPSEFRQSGST